MLKTPILAILRGINKNELEHLIPCFINTGIDTIEITMNTPNALDLIAYAKQLIHNKLCIGAGTVITASQLDSALKAGSEFIVSPVINEEVIQACVNSKIPIMPGALTPTEIWKAWSLGAFMVKVFPAGAFGSKYFKDILAPLDKIKLMAVGGVNSSNLTDYLSAGASAVAIGGSIFSRERLDNSQYYLIENDLKELVRRINTFNYA
jgi:2-dehydro-3-deoxyphosphogluconate aldolase / (4S)-4-hydroxy-2-oxoglutarate aldolase